MVKNPHSNAGDAGSIPGPGTKIPHAAGQLRPRATTTEPEHSGAHVPQLALEKPTRHNKEEPTCHNEDTVQEREREREWKKERKKERKGGREGGRKKERKKIPNALPFNVRILPTTPILLQFLRETDICHFGGGDSLSILNYLG